MVSAITSTNYPRTAPRSATAFIPYTESNRAMTAAGRVIVGLIWAAAPALCTRLPARVFTTMDGLARDAVFCIVPDSKGFLWFCTDEGLSRYDGYQFITYGIAHGLSHRVVNTLIETRSGVYFAGTDLGLNRLDPSVPPTSSRRFVKVPIADHPSSLQVRFLLEDRSGAVWCATSRGLYRLENPDGPDPVLRREPLGSEAPAPAWLAEDRSDSPDGTARGWWRTTRCRYDLRAGNESGGWMDYRRLGP